MKNTSKIYSNHQLVDYWFNAKQREYLNFLIFSFTYLFFYFFMNNKKINK